MWSFDLACKTMSVHYGRHERSRCPVDKSCKMIVVCFSRSGDEVKLCSIFAVVKLSFFTLHFSPIILPKYNPTSRCSLATSHLHHTVHALPLAVRIVYTQWQVSWSQIHASWLCLHITRKMHIAWMVFRLHLSALFSSTRAQVRCFRKRAWGQYELL